MKYGNKFMVYYISLVLIKKNYWYREFPSLSVDNRCGLPARLLLLFKNLHLLRNLPTHLLKNNKSSLRHDHCSQ